MSELRPRNLSQLQRMRAAELGGATAVRFRRGGAIHERSFAQLREEIDRVASSLLAEGVERGLRVALVADNCYEWLVADMAIAAIGAVSVPLHKSASARDVRAQIAHSGAMGVLTQGGEHAEALARARGELRFVVELGGEEWRRWTQRDEGVERVRAIEASLDGDALATIVYTSGTTDAPKGVMLTHGNFLFTLESLASTARVEAGAAFCAWLPWTHIFGRTVDVYMSLYFGASLFVGASMDEVLQDLQEARPRWFFAVPRFFEKLALAVAPLPAEARGGALRAALGGAIERVTCGGAALSPSVAQSFAEAGLPLREGYGMTEATAVLTMQQGERYRVGTVGYALEGTQIELAEDGEVLARGPHVMRGYWRDEEASAAALRDGALHTGDLGVLDADGFLRITGRKKDLLVLSTGKKLAPAPLEALLAEDPCVEHALVYGEGRRFLIAVLVPDAEVLRGAAPALAERLVGDGGVCRDAALCAFFAERARARLDAAQRSERVQAFLVTSRALDPAGELTPTREPRRARVAASFCDAIDALYAGDAAPS